MLNLLKQTTGLLKVELFAEFIIMFAYTTAVPFIFAVAYTITLPVIRYFYYKNN